MMKIEATPKELRKFGIMFAVICALIATFAIYKGHEWWAWWLGGSAFFLITGFFVHQILRPIYVGWMKFAFVLGWFNTRLILGLVYYLIFTPAALFLRLIRKDIMDLELHKGAPSYWIKREATAFDRKRSEHLF